MVDGRWYFTHTGLLPRQADLSICGIAVHDPIEGLAVERLQSSQQFQRWHVLPTLVFGQLRLTNSKLLRKFSLRLLKSTKLADSAADCYQIYSVALDHSLISCIIFSR